MDARVFGAGEAWRLPGHDGKRKVTYPAFLLATLLLAAGTAQAKTVEEIITLPVEVTDAKKRVVRHTITVTVWRDDTMARQPFLILNHGRAVNAEGRAKVGRARYSDNSAYLVRQGFAVFVPTRIGYGVTSGPDVEDSGACNARNYPPVYEAAAEQSIAVIDYAKQRPYVDATRGLVMGQSFGGAAAITLAARNIPGVRAAVNFAGGGGGNPGTRPQDPCSPERLVRLFASYGTTARIPTLWLYSENDRYFGAEKPRQWMEGFIKAGGSGRFVQLPPYKEDGHPSFTGQPQSWRPEFEAFVKEVMGR
jgi:dienelactone hydrolase